MRDHKTVLVNVKHRGQVSDIMIGRPGPWGNPFVIGRDGDRVEVIDKYKTYILGRTDLLKRLPELHGKRLGCFCRPDPCHGDVLIALIEGDL